MPEEEEIGFDTKEIYVYSIKLFILFFIIYTCFCTNINPILGSQILVWHHETDTEGIIRAFV